MPLKPMNAIAMKPAMIREIPGPSNAGGMLAVRSFVRIPLIATIASSHPIPLPRPKSRLVMNVYSRITMKRLAPRIAQFTVMRGRKIPSDWYSGSL